MLTNGVLIWPPDSTEKPSLVTIGRSLVVATVSVLVPRGPLVMPRRMIWSRSPPLANEPEKNPQTETWAAFGSGHEPTSTLRVTSWIVPLRQSGVVASDGSVTVLWLPPSLDIPPVAETANAAT